MGTASKTFRALAGVALAAVLFAVLPARAGLPEQCYDRTDPDKAISACTKMITVWDMSMHDEAAVHVWRGQALEDKGQFQSAFLDYRRAMTFYPSYGSAYTARARLYLRTGKFAYALRDAESEIKQDSKDAIAFDLRALAKAALGKADEAQADAATAATLGGDRADVHNARCWVRAVLNRDLTAALAACDLAIAKAPRANAYDSRGFVQFRLGNLAQARADYDAALALNPRSNNSLFMRGVIKRRTGDSSGDTDISAALALNPNVENEYALYGVTR